MATGLAGLLVVLVVIVLVLPIFRPPLIPLRDATGPASRMRDLEMRKATIYGAIREVGFDLRTDKITQEDYDHEITQLKKEAVGVVSEIEGLRSAAPRGDKATEAAIARARSTRPASAKEPAARASAAAPEPESSSDDAAAFCTQCGKEAASGDRFCAGCGSELRAT